MCDSALPAELPQWLTICLEHRPVTPKLVLPYNWSTWTNYGCHTWSPLHYFVRGGQRLGLEARVILSSACESHTDAG